MTSVPVYSMFYVCGTKEQVIQTSSSLCPPVFKDKHVSLIRGRMPIVSGDEDKKENRLQRCSSHEHFSSLRHTKTNDMWKIASSHVT